MPAPLNSRSELASVIDASIVEQLACPVCLGSLRVAETKLVCAGCGRSYPIVDGIPVLIAERAASLDR